MNVVSVAEQYPSPFATMILADLGASVIQIERPGFGDPARILPGLHGAMARGKRSLALNLKDPRSRAVMTVLLEHADIFMDGYRPRALARLRWDRNALTAANPELVSVSITGFGQTGPYGMRPGHEISYQALAGLLSDRGPIAAGAGKPALSLADLASGLYGAIAAWLLWRQRAGGGPVRFRLTWPCWTALYR